MDVALNEADVLGIRLEPSGAWCELLVHVLALPESGPINPDARRILRLASPARVGVLLRPLQLGPDKYGLVIPLDGLGEVEDFFVSLSWSDSMYGWAFLDVTSLTSDWPVLRPSLAINLRLARDRTRCSGSASAGEKNTTAQLPTASKGPSPSKIYRSCAPTRRRSR